MGMKMDREKPRILIVDDVYRNIQLAAVILGENTYHFSFATDGKSALEIARQGGIDLVLLDVMMPGMDGYAVCSELQSDQKTADIPVIFLTAKSDTDSVVKGFDLGAVDYLTKPFQAAELHARVRTHLKLRAVEQELREANAAKDRFFSIIAHDLRSPFTALVGVSQYLKDDIDALDPETAKEMISGIHTASKNAFSLLENLLHWARIQTGTTQLNPEELKLSDIINDNLQLLNVNISEKELQIKSQVPEDLKSYIDPQALNTVVRNLISNAIKFTPRGGEIRISAEPGGDEVVLNVSDTGVGMNQESIDALFHIDSRRSRKGTDQESGTGLGLILSKEFLDRSGGRITIESTPKKGSTFAIHIPAGRGD
jgi:two-component system, sensor histidine kinase and response regulator